MEGARPSGPLLVDIVDVARHISVDVRRSVLAMGVRKSSSTAYADVVESSAGPAHAMRVGRPT